MLTIAIGALVTAFASSAVSLRRAGQRGTALTLADTQMERYRTKTFTAVRIDGTLIPSSGTYVTAHSADSTIPASTGQATAGQNGDDTCPTSSAPVACLPVQNVTGPDGHSYRIDTYVNYVNNDATLSISDAGVGAHPEARDDRRPRRRDRRDPGARAVGVPGAVSRSSNAARNADREVVTRTLDLRARLLLLVLLLVIAGGVVGVMAFQRLHKSSDSSATPPATHSGRRQAGRAARHRQDAREAASCDACEAEAPGDDPRRIQRQAPARDPARPRSRPGGRRRAVRPAREDRRHRARRGARGANLAGSAFVRSTCGRTASTP